MSLTDVMDDVDYERQKFNENEALTQHPLWLTESHFVFHLMRSTEGQLGFRRDPQGEPLCSPRPLKEMVMQQVVVKPSRMKTLMGYEVPSDLYPSLLTEAIFQRSLQTVSHLVSTWPHPTLEVRSMLPAEDLDRCEQLTTPFDTSQPGGMSLLDSFMVGLLNLKPHAKLRQINFTGFKQDRKLCRELARLPILWMKPTSRQPGYIHSLIRHILGVSKNKVERYLNNISCIYSNMDLYVRHGHTIGPVTVVLDCKMTLDDVPIGLALQKETPFRYQCRRLWIEPIAEVDVPLTVIQNLLDPTCISHLELEEPSLLSKAGRWDQLLETLLLLPALRALSLPNTVHLSLYPAALHELAQAVGGLAALGRLNLASCHLKDGLHQLLHGLPQRLGYLSLRDCRLTASDLLALLEWPQVSELRELNLSRNNLQALTGLVDSLLDKMPNVVCFSVSFCSLSVVDIQQVVTKCKDCRCLKILAIQSFTPPKMEELRSLLEGLAEIPSLQRCLLLPEAYAFPGGHIAQRTANRESIALTCKEILEELQRPDLELE